MTHSPTVVELGRPREPQCRSRALHQHRPLSAAVDGGGGGGQSSGGAVGGVGGGAGCRRSQRRRPGASLGPQSRPPGSRPQLRMGKRTVVVQPQPLGRPLIEPAAVAAVPEATPPRGKYRGPEVGACKPAGS